MKRIDIIRHPDSARVRVWRFLFFVARWSCGECGHKRTMFTFRYVTKQMERNER